MVPLALLVIAVRVDQEVRQEVMVHLAHPVSLVHPDEEAKMVKPAPLDHRVNRLCSSFGCSHRIFWMLVTAHSHLNVFQ